MDRLMAKNAAGAIGMRARLVRGAAAACALTASLVLAATVHLTPLLAQSVTLAVPRATEVQSLPVVQSDTPAPAPSAAAAAPAATPSPAVQATPVSPAVQVSPAAQAAPAAAPAAVQGTSNPPAEFMLAVPREPGVEPPARLTIEVPDAGPQELNLPVIHTDRKTVIVQDGGQVGKYAHRWTGEDGHVYMVLNDNKEEPTADEKKKLEDQAQSAQRKAKEAAEKANQAYRLRSKQYIDDATIYLNSAAFKAWRSRFVR